jgi:hypothetical protein
MHLLKSFYFLSIGSLLFYFTFDNNTHGLSFHFYLCNVKDENTFYFEIFEILFFLFIVIFVNIFPISNMHRSLLSLVVHNIAEPKYIIPNC